MYSCENGLTRALSSRALCLRLALWSWSERRIVGIWQIFVLQLSGIVRRGNDDSARMRCAGSRAEQVLGAARRALRLGAYKTRPFAFWCADSRPSSAIP